MKKAISLLIFLVVSANISLSCDHCKNICPVRPLVLVRSLFQPIQPWDNLATVSDLSPAADTWALLCEQCAANGKQNNCVKCGAPGAKIQAMLCSQCAAGDNKNRCVKCGAPGATIPARLCDQCGYGEKKNECIKCGKR